MLHSRNLKNFCLNYLLIFGNSIFHRCIHKNSSKRVFRGGSILSLKERRARKVEAKPHGVQPYKPLQMQKPTTSSPAPLLENKPIPPSRVQIIDIFEGITLVEVAKRTGHSVSTLQNVLITLGEKVGSEYDPLSLDVVELVAMVFPSFSSKPSYTFQVV